MDAKSIYMACSHMRAKVSWEQINGNEWFYVGDDSCFKVGDVQNRIDKLFPESEIYLVIDRHRAFAVERKDAATTVELNLTSPDIVLCDKTFKRMLVFSHIGVAKYGEIVG